MSGNVEEDREIPNAVPLDLARNQISAVRSVEVKAPLVMASQPLRSVRVFTQGVTCSTSSSTPGQAIITNIVPQALIKQDNRTQITNVSTQAQNQITASLAIPRPAQITLSATPLVAQNSSGTSYHVPRGPAVVANLAAPRSNVTTVRSPMVVTAQSSQTHAFVRPARTPSPAQGTAWLTANTSNGSQLKAAPAVLSSSVRGAAVTGKIQVAGRVQPSQVAPTIKPGTVLQNSITIGQTGQTHSYKPAGIQALNTGVTVAQMLPARTQAVIYATNSSTQFTPATRVTVASAIQNQNRPPQTRPSGQVNGSRLSIPISQPTQSPRSVAAIPSPSVTSNSRISSITPTSQSQTVLVSSGRVVSTHPSNLVTRMSVAPSSGTSTATTITGTISSSNLLNSQSRISTLSTLNIQSLVAVASNGHNRIQTGPGAKVIAQPTQATIHLTSLPPTQIQTSNAAVTSATRTINVPATIVAQQRPTTVVAPDSISITKVFSTTESQNALTGTGVFIHAPLQTQRPTLANSTPSHVSVTQQHSIGSLPSTTVTLAGSSSYFYEGATAAAAYTRPLGQQPTAFATVPQSSTQQQARTPVSVNTQQVHGLVGNQTMRYNSVVMVDQNRSQKQMQFQANTIQTTIEPQNVPETFQHQTSPQQQPQSKLTPSSRPSILRKRDHEGSPLKAAKNLTTVLQNLTQQVSQGPPSPPSPRPDSRDNGHSSGGSTTISATSSPGLAEVNEDSNPLVPMNIKEEEELKPPIEMSPRKKPRKQQLAGNEIDENHDMQFITENGTTKKENYDSEDHHSESEPKDGAPEAIQVTVMRKPATASLLNGYRQTWKSTHNHYQRYSDVKPKDERRPTIMDLANQNRVQDKVNGWKIHHLSTQMEDLAEQEQTVYNRLTELLKFTEAEESNKQFNKDINRINELIKGNLQRIKIINDGMIDAKTQVMKVFEHQRHVLDIINRCASKRNFKKREKS